MTDASTLLATIAAIPWFYYPFVLLIGLLIGSFLNVVIFRTPKIMEQEFRQGCCEFLDIKNHQTKVETLSLSKPSSTCPRCKNLIKPWHNIPIISYLLLKGKCAHCACPISIRYPLVELATGLLTVLTIAVLGLSMESLVALLLLWSLIALAMIDIDTQLLPDSITLPLLWSGLIANSFGLYVELAEAVWGVVCGYLSLWSVFWLFKILTGKEGMGYGDFKLLAALGAWMGWQALPLIILLSSFVGACIGIAGIMMLGRDKNVPIPFGPYLAIAGWIAFLWGDHITQAYLRFLA
ncbi:methyltransferase [Candidatus Endobugula sertula]|uniref:Prepilin leader peptidase/N-methyltransferase n=1 Tax=Candidatus Endobugula sertula TaxID=62101 RepID=A0A1D2QP55_9GAMM|nr:methyltransferase [Candidatus Endobugula sertula]